MNFRNLKLLRSCSSFMILNKLTWNNSNRHVLERFLFTPQSFKIDAFQKSRKNFNRVADEDEYKNVMKNKCEADMDYLIFLEDIRNMLMITKTDDDLELLIKIVEKYSSQTNIIRFNSFSIGPELMRLFYILNKPQKALDLFKDPKTSHIFNEMMSWLILADLLFKNEMYEEGIEFFYLIESKQLQRLKYPPNLVIFFFASCYKVNSRQSFEEATKFVQEFEKIGFRMPLRAKCFYSALALNQKELVKASESLNTLPNFSIVINLKALIFFEKKEFDKLFDFLNKFPTDNSEIKSAKICISYDVLQYIEKALQETNDENLEIFKKIKEHLFSTKSISNKSWKNYLLEEIDYKKKYEL